MALDKITADKIYEHSMERVANRPTAAARFGTGGLSPAQLKARYDQLPLAAIDKINELIDKIKAGADGDTILKYMLTPIPGDDDDTPRTLYELLQDITNGDIATYLTLRSLTKTTLWDELHHIELELAEAKRIQAEEEAKRAAAEKLRVEAESGRVTAEQERVVAESNRVAAESSRENQEQRRQSFEQARQKDEAQRITAEQARKAVIEEIIRAKENGELNGKDFSISKIYGSVAEMHAGFATDNVEYGQFVLINTGDVEDPDNAKMFVKKEGGYSYLTDLSGSAGIQGPAGGPGPTGPQGERGLAYYRLKSNLVGSLEYYPFTDFLIPEGYVPKPYDLVLYNDGNLGYIYSVTEDEKLAAVAHIPNAALKGPTGPDGFSPTVSVSKRNGVATVTITDKEGTKTVDILDGSANGGIDPGIFIDNKDIIPETEVVLEGTPGASTMAFIHSDIKPMVGEIYGVFWNGTKYSCEAKLASNDYVVLGNGMIWGLPATSDPFCITFYNREDENNVQVRSIDYLETVNLRVALPPMIDPKYIPDMYYEEDSGAVEILPEMTIPVDPDNPTIPSNYEFDIAAGDILTVKWNGVEYVCTVQDVSGAIGMPGVALGDLTSAGLSGNGEPFMMVYSPELMEAQGMSGFYGMIAVLDGSTSVTLSIIKGGKTIHHIPHKFIKDMYYTEIYEEKEILSEMTLPTIEYAAEEILFVLKAGYPYTVVYNGTEYKCVCKSAVIEDLGSINYLGYNYIFGGENTGEPFAIFNINGMTYFGNANANATIRIIEGGELVHKIDKKYIPDTAAVPTTRKVNGKALSSDITLTASDVSAVPTTRTVNGKALSSDITLSATDVSAVPTTRKVNGKDLSSDIVLSSRDVNGVEGKEYEIGGETVVAAGYAEVFNYTVGNKAVGYSSHAEGYSTTASGPRSHAEGQDTAALGGYSHAEGHSTQASGHNSHAEGYATFALGDLSHAEGYRTSASGDYSHVQGRYNIADTENKYAHIVGNGNDEVRSNAHTLDWYGNAWYAGTIEGTALILKSSTSGSTKRFKITVDDSGKISALEIVS